MENHYNPELNEYTLGMECKIQTPNGIKIGCFPDIFLLNNELNQFKEDYNKAAHAIVWVKHLDRQDIESLGWFYKDTSPGGYDYFWDTKTEKHSILYSPKLKRAIITVWDDVRKEDSNAFVGIIKNKSELMKILVQAGIAEAQ